MSRSIDIAAWNVGRTGVVFEDLEDDRTPSVRLLSRRTHRPRHLRRDVRRQEPR